MTDVQYISLNRGNTHLLKSIADGVFDHQIESHYIDIFLQGNQNILFIAVRAGTVIGMVSGILYNHPDKPRELWVNEIGVADKCRRQGIAKCLLESICVQARGQGCSGAWLLTENDNLPANSLYQSMPNWSGPKDQVMYWVDFVNDDTPSQ